MVNMLENTEDENKIMITNGWFVDLRLVRDNSSSLMLTGIGSANHIAIIVTRRESYCI